MNKKIVLPIIGGIISLAIAIYSFGSIITNDPLPSQEPSSQVKQLLVPLLILPERLQNQVFILLNLPLP